MTTKQSTLGSILRDHSTRKAKSSPPAVYALKPASDDDTTIARALVILRGRLNASTDVLTSPDAVRSYLTLKIATLQHEVFGCLFLDSQHRLLVDEQLFRGTLAQTSVYPREVLKAALACNAGAVIFYHNHPSGVAEPSRADELLTAALKQALALVDTRVLDHFIVGGATVTSFAERGLL